MARRRIRLLDCTLRDGGYITDWKFGRENIISIYERLADAGTDIIEVGFLDARRPYDPDRSIMPDTEAVNRIYGGLDKRGSLAVGMVDYGTCGTEHIQPKAECFLDGIRVIFKKEDRRAALEYCRQLKELGYMVFAQLVSVTSYTDEEFLDLISLVNSICTAGTAGCPGAGCPGIDCISMADTYGVMHADNVAHYFHMLDEGLLPGICIGYHAHNSFQLAYANCMAFMEMGLETDRDIIADGTLFGMGKSAGNAPSELLAMHLNLLHDMPYTQQTSCTQHNSPGPDTHMKQRENGEDTGGVPGSYGTRDAHSTGAANGTGDAHSADGIHSADSAYGRYSACSGRRGCVICGTYEVGQMLEAIDASVLPFYGSSAWGYSIQYFLSALNACHPKYVSYLTSKRTLSVSSINDLLSQLPEEKRLTYDESFMEQMYREFQCCMVQDEEDISRLSAHLAGREVCVLGPGRSIPEHRDEITEYIREKRCVCIAINFIPDGIPADYVFLSNSKRYVQLCSRLLKSRQEIIATSNVTPTGLGADGFAYTVNYSSLTDPDAEIPDNSLVMLLKLLLKAGVTDVALAGCDGYSPFTPNYLDQAMEYDFIRDKAYYLNSYTIYFLQSMKDMLHVTYITPSEYDK